MPKPQSTLYVISGCNGAGKTTFAREFLPSVGVRRFLNADEIARGLSPLDPQARRLRAGRLMLSEFRDLMQRGESFGVESTLSGRTYVHLFRQAKDRGYAIELHFIWLPEPREAIRRVRQRVREGGHHVPAADIRRRFARGLKHLVSDYAPLANEWFIWDNSAPPATLLAQSQTRTTIDLAKLITPDEERL
jgi:predicted ABC-type ATPase